MEDLGLNRVVGVTVVVWYEKEDICYVLFYDILRLNLTETISIYQKSG